MTPIQDTGSRRSTNESYLRDGRAPVPASSNTSRVMRANKGRDTGPELLLRRQLIQLGTTGYRLHRSDVLGRPDVSFRRKKVAVFVNGCFWHRCPHCRLPLPRTHVEFWSEKFAANRRRDAVKTGLLIKAGWKVLVLWECEIRKNPLKAAQKVGRALGQP